MIWGIRKADKFAILDIPLEEIKPNSYQPRKEFDVESMSELTNSIKEHGIIQPIVVRRAEQGYEIIAGERRWRACHLAGLTQIPAIVKDAEDSVSAVLALVENLQREDLNFIEEAQGYRQLLKECSMTQEQIAVKLGKSQSTIANKLRVLKLPSKILQIISREKLTERHARSLLRLKDEKMQEDVILRAAAKGLSVRETEEMVERLLEREMVPKESKEKTFKVSIKDVRIFVNSVRNLVKSIKETGVSADYREVDKGDHIELTVSIPKR